MEVLVKLVRTRIYKSPISHAWTMIFILCRSSYYCRRLSGKIELKMFYWNIQCILYIIYYHISYSYIQYTCFKSFETWSVNICNSPQSKGFLCNKKLKEKKNKKKKEKKKRKKSRFHTFTAFNLCFKIQKFSCKQVNFICWSG